MKDMKEKKDLFFRNSACPVNCEYCMVTKITKRKKDWYKQHRYGINKSILFLNKFPFEEGIINFNKEFLKGEFISFESISDPFWNVYKKDLIYLLENSLESKKVILVTKFRITKEYLDILKNFPQVNIIISFTGLDKYNIEKTSTTDRIKNIEDLMKCDIPFLPLIHPYIHSMSDLSFLKDLKKLGVNIISYKGFRFNKETMPTIYKNLPKDILEEYIKHNEDEVLIGEDYIKEQIKLAGDFKIVSSRIWTHFFNTKHSKNKGFEDEKEAKKVVEELFSNYNITISSSEKNIQEIKNIAIKRRMKGFEDEKCLWS